MCIDQTNKTKPNVYNKQVLIWVEYILAVRESKMDNPEKMVIQGTQDEDKQNKNTICVGHHYAQTNKQKCK